MRLAVFYLKKILNFILYTQKTIIPLHYQTTTPLHYLSKASIMKFFETQFNFHQNIRIIETGSEHKFYGGDTNKPFAGNFKIPTVVNLGFVIYRLDEYDQVFIAEKGIQLKDEEMVFRYQTDTTRISGISPLIKINLKNGMVYFNAADSDTEDVIFETRGTKFQYLNLASNFTN